MAAGPKSFPRRGRGLRTATPNLTPERLVFTCKEVEKGEMLPPDLLREYLRREAQTPGALLPNI